MVVEGGKSSGSACCRRVGNSGNSGNGGATNEESASLMYNIQDVFKRERGRERESGRGERDGSHGPV